MTSNSPLTADTSIMRIDLTMQVHLLWPPAPLLQLNFLFARDRIIIMHSLTVPRIMLSQFRPSV